LSAAARFAGRGVNADAARGGFARKKRSRLRHLGKASKLVEKGKKKRKKTKKKRGRRGKGNMGTTKRVRRVCVLRALVL